MHDENTVQRSIELRASGWTYAQLMTKPFYGGTSSMSPHLSARPGGRADLPVRLPSSKNPQL
jgi:hypothetical protein